MPVKLSATGIKELIASKNKKHGAPHVVDLSLYDSLDKNRISYALIEFSSPREAKLVKKQLAGHWIEDKQVKVRTQEDLIEESFDNRTIFIENIPCDMKNKELIEMFGEYGAVVGVEMPTHDLFIEKELAERKDVKLDKAAQEKADQRERNFRKAQKVINGTINAENQYEEQLEQLINQEGQ
jgi:hypothetical protein